MGRPVVLPLGRVEVGHSVLDQLLLVPEGSSANVAVALQRVLLVVVDPLVLHPAAVAGEDGAALPATDVRLDARVRVQVPFHVSLKKCQQLILNAQNLAFKGKFNNSSFDNNRFL